MQSTTRRHRALFSPFIRVTSMALISCSFPDRGMHVTRLQHMIRRPKAQIVHMIADVGPAVRDARWNDDDIARLPDLFDDVAARDPAAARRSVPLRSRPRVRRSRSAVADVTAGHERAAARGDAI